MKKNAYQYLFGTDTLYRVPETEVPMVPVVQVTPVQTEPFQTESIQAESIQTESAPVTEPTAPVVLAQPGPEPVAVASAPEPEIPEPPKPVVPQINQQVLLLFDEELTPSEQILLENILKAVNLNMAGVDMLNLAGLGLLNLRPVLASKRVHHFISFGVPLTEINLNITLNRYDIRNLAGINFMLTDPLSAIEADRALKRQLWVSLQKMFLGT